MIPAMKLPIEIDKNHTPIINPTMRAGASFVTVLKPTGLKHNSPSDWKK